MHEVWVGHIFWSPVWIFTVVPPKISFYLFGWNEHLQGLLDEELQALMGDSQAGLARTEEEKLPKFLDTLPETLVPGWLEEDPVSFLPFLGRPKFWAANWRFSFTSSTPWKTSNHHPWQKIATFPRHFLPALKNKATFVRRYLRPAEAILIKLQDSTNFPRTEGWLSCDEDWIVFGWWIFWVWKKGTWSFFFVKCVWVSIVFTFFFKEKVDTVFFRKKKLWNEKNDKSEKKTAVLWLYSWCLQTSYCSMLTLGGTFLLIRVGLCRHMYI